MEGFPERRNGNGSFSVPITNNERAHVPLHPQRTTPNNARKKTRAADADAPPRKISPGPRSPEYVLRNRERARRILGREGAERRGEEVIDRGMHTTGGKFLGVQRFVPKIPEVFKDHCI